MNTASAMGVTVSVDPNAWRGHAAIGNDVTPVRVKIANDSDRKLRIRFRNFSIVSGTGERYRALPPLYVSDKVTGPELARRYLPLHRLQFTYRGFNVGSSYRFYYPGLAVAATQHLDRGYHDRYFRYWAALRPELPTREMLQSASPEGVLDQGGVLAGFLYFEKIDGPATMTGMTFKADIVDAASNRSIASVAIPLTMQDNLSAQAAVY